MPNRLNDIVNVSIDIKSPAIDSASFDNLLIIGAPPLGASAETLPVVGEYRGLEDVANDGYKTTGEDAEPVGIAARVAFSQSPAPSRVYIAAHRPAMPLISDAKIKVITAANALTDAMPIGSIDGATAKNLPWIQVEYSRDAVNSIDVEIVKDGVTRYGKTLPGSENSEAYLQVCIGSTSDAAEDQMNIVSGEEAGKYNVILTAASGKRTTTCELGVSFDGTNYIADSNIYKTTPMMQSVVETLTAALETDGWYVVCAAGASVDEIKEIAEWTETQRKMFAYTFLSKKDPIDGEYYRSFGICGLVNDNDSPETVPVSNGYLHVAMTAKCLSYSAGSNTWAFKQLSAVTPSSLSNEEVRNLVLDNDNYFTKVAGRNTTMNGKVRAGEWIDVIRGRDWLQNDMQLRLFNLMVQNPVIHFTNSGIAKVQNEMIASLKEAQTRGIVAASEYDDDGELVVGFVTKVPNSLSITAAQKATRVLSGCTFYARLAGAIHAIDVNGSLSY